MTTSFETALASWRDLYLPVAIAVLLAAGGVAKGQVNDVSSPVVIINSGSTNSSGFALTVNPDGSGHLEMPNDRRRHSLSNLSGKKDFPSGLFDYVGLKKSIESVPNITKKGNCAKSISFGFTLTVTCNNVTSADLTCQFDPEIQDLLRVIDKTTSEANCYGFDDQGCQRFKEEKATGIDSGIAGSAEAIEMSPDGKYIKKLDPIYAKLKIFKSDGSFVREIETKAKSGFYALLLPGKYFMTDESAGLSTRPIGFFDANDWKIVTHTQDWRGRPMTVEKPKPFPDRTENYPDRIEFVVTQHHFNSMGLYFDGESLKQ